VLQARPNAALALNNRGTLYLRKGALQSALDDFNASVKNNPNLYLAHANRGRVLSINKDFDGALADFAEADRSDPAAALEQVIAAVGGARKLRLVMLDACRDNPFAPAMQRTIALKLVDKGFSNIEPAAGFMVVYAAKHGETALDGEGTDSPFAVALARDIREPRVEVRKLFDIVRDDVWTASRHQQQPFTYGSPPGREDFYFVTGK
jgi:uncharacterized caspase-like protein